MPFFTTNDPQRFAQCHPMQGCVQVGSVARLPAAEVMPASIREEAQRGCALIPKRAAGEPARTAPLYFQPGRTGDGERIKHSAW